AGKPQAASRSARSLAMVSHERNSSLEVQQIGDVTVLRFATAVIDDEEVVETIGRQVAHLVERCGRRHLVFDCATLDAVVSSMMSKFVTIHKMLTRVGGRLVVCNLCPVLREVFTRLRLPFLFTVCD